MPIIIREDLPAYKVLIDENVFIINQGRARGQDIRALKIAILNLMPNKIETEIQFLRLLSNTSLQVEIELLQTETHDAKNVTKEYLTKFYKNFNEVKDKKYDGLIITGAPVEKFAFEEVDYWSELCEIMEWSKTNVYSVLHICWGAQAGLYYHYGIPKYSLSEKRFGLFPHVSENRDHTLLRGFDDQFMIPHSRHTEIKKSDIEKIPGLSVLASSEKSGVGIVADKSDRMFFVTGHMEYDTSTLHKEYIRDKNKNLPIQLPRNYYPNGDTSLNPINTWRAHGNLLFSNWLNYYVYQVTPYEL